MNTQVRTPQDIFMMPQRFLVPLFQRPYVWSEEHQWDPLWRDLERVAQRVLDNPTVEQKPHFLGAIVLQQVMSVAGSMQEWSVIDGQQRLTTLQILLDALHAELVLVEAHASAARLEPLIENQAAFRKHDEDRFKVWPTNRDRPAFNDVMGAVPPVKHDQLQHRDSRMVQAHKYFSIQARQWLTIDGTERVLQRGEAIERAARELLQIVAIQLSPNENAQEIFETLNARGTPLSVADLIKNFVFQKLVENRVDVQAVYDKQWAQFEQAFWEVEVGSGRPYYQRFSLFLVHWLTARTGEVIPTREVFSRFKTYAEFESGISIEELVNRIARSAAVYRRLTEASVRNQGDLTREELFAYRLRAMDFEIMKPLLLVLLDPEQEPLPTETLVAAVTWLESWIVRRSLVRASSRSATASVASLVRLLKYGNRSEADKIIAQFLMSQTSETMYWPDDKGVRTSLLQHPVYAKLLRSRLRMILEALEDNRRGYDTKRVAYPEGRVARGLYTIEHVLPVYWNQSWPLPLGMPEEERQNRVHTLGNLTLVVHNLNASISNGPWLSKSEALRKHSILLINSDLLQLAESDWTDELIETRTQLLIERILEIWPVPEGHVSQHLVQKPTTARQIWVADLVASGHLQPGQQLFPVDQKIVSEVSAFIVSDGRIEVNGSLHTTPTAAAKTLRPGDPNGWQYWLVDLATRKSLHDVRREYMQASQVEGDNGSDDSGAAI